VSWSALAALAVNLNAAGGHRRRTCYSLARMILSAETRGLCGHLPLAWVTTVSSSECSPHSVLSMSEEDFLKYFIVAHHRPTASRT